MPSKEDQNEKSIANKRAYYLLPNNVTCRASTQIIIKRQLFQRTYSKETSEAGHA